MAEPPQFTTTEEADAWCRAVNGAWYEGQHVRVLDPRYSNAFHGRDGHLKAGEIITLVTGKIDSDGDLWARSLDGDNYWVRPHDIEPEANDD